MPFRFWCLHLGYGHGCSFVSRATDKVSHLVVIICSCTLLQTLAQKGPRAHSSCWPSSLAVPQQKSRVQAWKAASRARHVADATPSGHNAGVELEEASHTVSLQGSPGFIASLLAQRPPPPEALSSSEQRNLFPREDNWGLARPDLSLERTARASRPAPGSLRA